MEILKDLLKNITPLYLSTRFIDRTGEEQWREHRYVRLNYIIDFYKKHNINFYEILEQYYYLLKDGIYFCITNKGGRPSKITIQTLLNNPKIWEIDFNLDRESINNELGLFYALNFILRYTWENPKPCVMNNNEIQPKHIRNIGLQDQITTWNLLENRDWTAKDGAIYFVLTEQEVLNMTKELIKTKLPREANPMDYLPWPLFFNNKKTKKIYGIELEVSTRYSPAQIIDFQESPFMISKHDGSISGCFDNALELVTVPGSYTGLKVAFRKFFQKIDLKNFDTSKQTGNGLHIHINREYLSTDHAEKLNWFFQSPNNRVFIEAISERSSRDLARWGTLIDWSREGLEYITEKTQIQEAWRMAQSIRGGVNIATKTHKTIEIRIFKGIVGYTSLMKALDFVDSVVVYTENVTTKNKLEMEHYLKWLMETPQNNYKVLKRFIEATDIYKKCKTYIFQNMLHSNTSKRTPFKFLEEMSKQNISQKTVNGRLIFFTVDENGGTVEIPSNNELLDMIAKKKTGFLAELDEEFLKEQK